MVHASPYLRFSHETSTTRTPRGLPSRRAPARSVRRKPVSRFFALPLSALLVFASLAILAQATHKQVTVAQSGGTTTVTEGGAPDTYTLVLTAAPSAPVSITITPDAQVTVQPTTVVFTQADFNQARTIVVLAADDAAVEASPHTGTIAHAAMSGDSDYDGISIASVSVAITDNDALPTVTIAVTDGTATEGATDQAVLTITRSSAPPTPLVVRYTLGGTASLNNDYLVAPPCTASPCAIIIPPTLADVAITIAAVDDTTAENAETVIATLQTDAAYTVGGANAATATINDNEPSLTIAATDNAADEDGGTGTFTITSSAASTGPIVASLAVTGTATLNQDYTLTPPCAQSPCNVVIEPGATSATLGVTPVNDLTASEGTETIIATLQAAAGYAVESPASGTVNLADNEPTVTLAANDATAAEAASATGQFTLTRTGATTNALPVVLALTGTATYPADYSTDPNCVPTNTGATCAVTILAGSLTALVTVTPVDDPVAESAETIVATIQAQPGYAVGTPSSDTVTITDNDASVSIDATDATATEGGDGGTFTVTRSGGTVGPLPVFYTLGGTATLTNDYTLAPACDTSGQGFCVLVIPDGSATATIALATVDNAVAENPETVVATLQARPHYGIGSPPTATITIADDEVPIVSITATDSSASETGSATGTFTLTRTFGDLTSTLTVTYAVSGTAIEGTDYAAIGTTALFAAGSATTTITITPVDDSAGENTETVIVTIVDGAAYNVGTPSATVNILDDDVSVSVTATDSAASEPGTDTGTFTITRTGSTAASLAVSYTATGTATSGADYTSIGTSVTIAAGDASATVTVTPLDDTTDENAETVILTVTSTAGTYTVGSPISATVTISDDDLPVVTVTANDDEGSEQPSTSTADTIQFTFTRVGVTTAALSVSYALSGTATLVTDYTVSPACTSSPCTVSIAAGAATAVVTITPVDDAADEPGETVIATLAASASYTVGTPSTDTATITDNDLASVAVAANDNAASEPGTDTGQFTVTRTGDTTNAVTLPYHVTGSATLGTDYTLAPACAASPCSLTIAAGSATATITVTPADDAAFEPSETVTVAFTTNPFGHVVDPTMGTATVTITDDEVQIDVVANDPVGRETGSDPAAFTVARAGSTAGTLSVTYTVAGTATLGTDYTLTPPCAASPCTLAFGDAQASAPITVTPVDDAATEAVETVQITIAAGSGYSVGPAAAAEARLLDNEPTVNLAAHDPIGRESATPDVAAVTVLRAPESIGALSVTYAVAGTATLGTDYTITPACAASPCTVTIDAGQPTATITITPTDDVAVEAAETVILTLAAGASYSSGAANSATLTLLDNEPTVNVVASDPLARETGPDSAVFTVARAVETDGSLIVTYTLSGTATLGTDYSVTPSCSASPCSLTIGSNQATATITITPTDDAAIESTETVIATLAAGTGYTVGSSSQATANLLDNEPTVNLAAHDPIGRETGPDPAAFTVARGPDTAGPLSITYSVGGTAVLGTDYTISPACTASPCTLAIPGNQASATITITPADDSSVEATETVILTLAAGPYTLGPATQATANLLDNEPTVNVVAHDPLGRESGAEPAAFTFVRGPEFVGDLEVSFNVAGTAALGTDYTLSNGCTVSPCAITILATNPSATLTATPVDDALVETTETVVITVAGSTGYTVGSASQASASLVDDESLPACVTGGTSSDCSDHLLTVLVGTGGISHLYVDFDAAAQTFSAGYHYSTVSPPSTCTNALAPDQPSAGHCELLGTSTLEQALEFLNDADRDGSDTVTELTSGSNPVYPYSTPGDKGQGFPRDWDGDSIENLGEILGGSNPFQRCSTPANPQGGLLSDCE